MHVMRIVHRCQVAFTTCQQGSSSSWEEPVRALFFFLSSRNADAMQGPQEYGDGD